MTDGDSTDNRIRVPIGKRPRGRPRKDAPKVRYRWREKKKPGPQRKRPGKRNSWPTLDKIDRAVDPEAWTAAKEAEEAAKAERERIKAEKRERAKEQKALREAEKKIREEKRNRPDAVPGKLFNNSVEKKKPVHYDLDLVHKLGLIHASDQECAILLGMNTQTFRRLMKEDVQFKVGMERGRAQGKRAIRQKQYDMAMEDNEKMLVWLGKNILGQADKKEVEHAAKDPLKALLDEIGANNAAPAIAGDDAIEVQAVEVIDHVDDDEQV